MSTKKHKKTENRRNEQKPRRKSEKTQTKARKSVSPTPPVKLQLSRQYFHTKKKYQIPADFVRELQKKKLKKIRHFDHFREGTQNLIKILSQIRKPHSNTKQERNFRSTVCEPKQKINACKSHHDSSQKICKKLIQRLYRVGHKVSLRGTNQPLLCKYFFKVWKISVRTL